MKILDAVFILMLLSTALARSQDRRIPKKSKNEPAEEEHRNRHHKRTPFPGFNDKGGFTGTREKPRIPYVDEEKRGRQPRQSFITLQVPTGNQGFQVGSPFQFQGSPQSGGHNQGGNGFQANSPLQFQGSSQSENHNQGGFQQDAPLQFTGSSQGESNYGSQGSNGFQPGPLVQFVGGSQSGNLIPGNQGGGIQQGTPLQFQDNSQGGNHQGNQGGVTISGSFSSSPSTGNHGGGGTFQSGTPDSSENNGFFPGSPGLTGGGSSGNSAVDGPGGLSSSVESGLPGGLGGVYGGGYGFGLGGLVFGGPAGPVFAGNTALIEGLGSNEDEGSNDNSDNQKDALRTTLLRPVRPRGNFFDGDEREETKTKVNNQAIRGGTSSVYPRIPTRPEINKTAEKNAGETIGYVAFIFPRRANKPTTHTPERSTSTGNQKSTNDAVKSKIKVSAIINRLAPYFVPVPVHIPIDRPYPVPVPKAYPVHVLKPYPVAVPKPVPVAVPFAEPVPYEVAKPIPVPVAVEVPKPVNDEFPVLVRADGQPSSSVNLFFQPSIDTRIIHKRSDKAVKAS